MDIALNDLIGKPFNEDGKGPEAYNCLSLAREVYHRAWGIWLPEYTFLTVREEIAQKISSEEKKYRKLEKPEPFCIATFWIEPPLVTHIGIVLENCIDFINVRGQTSVCIERMDDMNWKHRLSGLYYYEK